MRLSIRSLAGVVLVLVVGVEFEVLAYREQETRIKSGSAPFAVMARVVGFRGHVRESVERAERKRALDR